MEPLRMTLRRTVSKSIGNRASASRRIFTSSTSHQRSPVKTGLYATLFGISTGLFAIYYFDARSALHRYLVTPLIRYTLDAETGHKFAIQVLRSGFSPRDPIADDVKLAHQIWGETVSNPVGLAAGFDKDGEAIEGLYNLGFSWVEVGSVTPRSQPGNPRPRVFHLPEDNGLINRYGFPSQGHVAVLSRLRARIPSFLAGSERAALRDGALLAVNLGKNKDSPTDSIDDFVAGIRAFGPYSDVLVVNVSSPNTPGLRGLQNRDALEKLLAGVIKTRDELPVSPITAKKPKLVLKIAPDLSETQLIEMAEVIRKSNIDGVIVSNTTIQRPLHLLNPNKQEMGGLSGAPIKPYSLKALRTLRTHLPASIALIGCGGIASGADALEYAKSGATMVQMYTGLGYDGVGACRRVKDELVGELVKEGKTWGEVVENAVRELSLKELPRLEIKQDDNTVSQLISEAEELKKLLNELGDKMGHDKSS